MAAKNKTYVLHAFPDPLGIGTWLTLECGHWYHWAAAPADRITPVAPPKSNDEFTCPSCVTVEVESK